MIRRIALFSLAFLCLAVSASRADFLIDVTPTVSQDPVTKMFTYSYLVYNPIANADDGDPDLVFDFSVNVDPQAALTQIISPPGWDATYSLGATVVEWAASDDPFVLSPGDSLTFGFVSALGPGDQGFSALALNQGGTNVDLVGGTTTGPTARGVPEPSSLLLCGCGIFGVLGFARWRRGSTT